MNRDILNLLSLHNMQLLVSVCELRKLYPRLQDRVLMSELEFKSEEKLTS